MISIQNDKAYIVDVSRLEIAIQTVIERHDVPDTSSVTVVLTTNDEVRRLNATHRGIDAPTDVLSFPADPLPPELQEENEHYLGDLVIAYPYALAQSEKLNHLLDDSLCLLVIHGTLHLLGYDHDIPENRAEMWAEQAQVLAMLDIDDAIVPALEDSDHA
ncbi:MAG: rRNA maturation RNase YbeY [Chloroflexota bacterium]